MEKNCVNDRKPQRGVQRVVRGVHFALGVCRGCKGYYSPITCVFAMALISFSAVRGAESR